MLKIELQAFRVADEMYHLPAYFDNPGSDVFYLKRKVFEL